MASTNQLRSVLPEPAPLDLTPVHEPRTRAALIKRLSDIVALPETRMPANERQLAADILMALLRTASVEMRARCAQGLVRVHDAPKALLRYLARDEIAVAQPLLEGAVGFDDSDLIASVRSGLTQHWLLIARRRTVSEAVADALAQTGDVAVLDALLRNAGARLSAQGVDVIVARSRRAPQLTALLAQRPEVRPTQALVMFWWSDFETRLQIVRRYAVDRNALIGEMTEVFAIAAAEGWSDADARKALQVVERRQRNRAAAERSPYGSLEGAIQAAERGMDRNMAHEIGHLAGVRPATAMQIFTDPGGEAVGVFCKAVGLKRPMLLALWRALRRPLGEPDSSDNPLGRALHIFDMLATAKAQTVLRYWNWSFTADAAALDKAELDDAMDGDGSQARRNALLLFNRNG